MGLSRKKPIKSRSFGIVKNENFDQLVASIQEALEIKAKRREPSRIFEIKKREGANMISREMLKAIIDHLDDEHLAMLDGILNFLALDRGKDAPMKETKGQTEGTDWRAFLEKFAGCMKDAPIKRQPQSDVGPRTNLAEFLRKSPLYGVELDLEREKE